MTNATSKPATQAQLTRINALLERGIISIEHMPTTSWEASAIIRNSAASKRDKEQLKNSGGRILTRMTTGELEMTTKALAAINDLSRSQSKDPLVLNALTILRAQFAAKSSQ